MVIRISFVFAHLISLKTGAWPLPGFQCLSSRPSLSCMCSSMILSPSLSSHSSRGAFEKRLKCPISRHIPRLRTGPRRFMISYNTSGPSSKTFSTAIFVSSGNISLSLMRKLVAFDSQRSLWLPYLHLSYPVCITMQRGLSFSITGIRLLYRLSTASLMRASGDPMARS